MLKIKKLLKVAKQLLLSYIAIITKSNPKQAIDLTIAHTKFGQTSIAKLKSAHNSLIIGRRGLGYETSLYKIMGWESSGLVRFDFGPLLQGQMRIPKLKSAYNSLIIGPRGLGW